MNLGDVVNGLTTVVKGDYQKKYYNCPCCKERRWAYGQYAGSICWKCRKQHGAVINRSFHQLNNRDSNNNNNNNNNNSSAKPAEYARQLRERELLAQKSKENEIQAKKSLLQQYESQLKQLNNKYVLKKAEYDSLNEEIIKEERKLTIQWSWNNTKTKEINESIKRKPMQLENVTDNMTEDEQMELAIRRSLTFNVGNNNNDTVYGYNYYNETRFD